MKSTIEELTKIAEIHALDLSTVPGFERAEKFALRLKQDAAAKKIARLQEAERDYFGTKTPDGKKHAVMMEIAKERGLNSAKDFHAIEQEAADRMRRAIGVRFFRLCVQGSNNKFNFSKVTSASDIAEQIGLSEGELMKHLPDWSRIQILQFIRQEQNNPQEVSAHKSRYF